MNYFNSVYTFAQPLWRCIFLERTISYIISTCSLHNTICDIFPKVKRNASCLKQRRDCDWFSPVLREGEFCVASENVNIFLPSVNVSLKKYISKCSIA